MKRLSNVFVGMMFATWFLAVFGALVRAHGAGLACPDWPLCFGEVIPTLDFGVFFEFGHRALAGTVGLVFLGASIAVFRDAEARAAAGRLVVAAGVVLAVQIALGGLTVLQLLASWTVTSHLLAGNTFCLMLLIVALRLRGWSVDGVPDRVRAGVALTALALLAQITLGGLVSSNFAGLACTTWPECFPGSWVPTWNGPAGLQVLHRLGAYTLATVALWTAWTTRGTGLAPLGALLAVLVFAQIGVGVANVLLYMPVEVTGLHSAFATAIVLTTTALGVGAFGRSEASSPLMREALA